MTAVNCDRCGRFKITFECLTDYLVGDHVRPAISAATRQAWASRRSLVLRTDNLETVENEHRWTSVQEKSRKILEYIRVKSNFFTEIVKIAPMLDYPLFDAYSDKECEQLLNHLFAEQLISHDAQQAPHDWSLTMKGWNFIEPLAPGGVLGRCFVAMAFVPELDLAYFEGIKAAIIEAGYEAVCMKEYLTNDNICDVILAEIRKAQFVVADFTLQKGGVYFEAGFAKALGKEVFWLCRDDDFDNLHFDTNHYGHIKWREPQDLKRQLMARIIAEIGEGPRARR